MDFHSSISKRVECASKRVECAQRTLAQLGSDSQRTMTQLVSDSQRTVARLVSDSQRTLAELLSDLNRGRGEKPMYEEISALARVKGDRVLHPAATFLQCRCSPRHKCVSTTREQQAIRKRVLEQAAKDHSTGKTWTTEHVLAAYGSHEIKLDGQEAVTADIGRDSWCTECQKRCTQCIWVERDRFWNRNQCVACVRRKVSCSLDKFGSKGQHLEG